MKKIKSFGLFALAGLALTSTALVSCSNKNANGKTVYAINNEGEVGAYSTFEVLYKENSDIPYISLNDGVELMNALRSQRLSGKGSVKLAKEGNNYVISNELGAKCVANPENQTFTYSDFDAFTTTVPSNQKPISLVNVYDSKALKEVSNNYTAGKEITIDLKPYSLLDLYVKNDKCYLPLSVYNSAVFNAGENFNLAYNGNAFYLISGTGLVDTSFGVATQTKIGEMFYENAQKSSISKEFSEYNYQTLCFDFDHEYGLRSKFTSFDEFLKNHSKENILSTDPYQIDNYTSSAFSYLEDGHTAMASYSNLYEFGDQKIDKSIADPYMNYWVEASDAYALARKNANIVDGIEYRNDTAFVTFSSFTSINDDLLYLTSDLENLATDSSVPSFDPATNTATLFSKLYKDLTSDTYKNTIKNIVVDVSANDGGNGDGLMYALSTLLGKVGVDMVNYVTTGHNRQEFMADINNDGKIDSNDKSLSDLGFKIYFLDSDYSFSSANAMPVLAKLNNSNVVTLGQKTHGGPCAVRIYMTPIGSCFQASSLTTISKLENGKYVDIDYGVDADYALTEAQMVDRAYIANNINNWVKK